MYKVSEVAELLGIPKTKVFEKLISYNDVLKPYVKKKSSITYIDEMGVTLIKKMVEGSFTEKSTPSDFIDKEVNQSGRNDFDNEDTDEICRSKIDEVVSETGSPKENEKKKSTSNYISLKQSLEDLFKIKSDINEEIMEMKLKLNAVDQDIRKKDSAILHYQLLLKEDLEWLSHNEKKIYVQDLFRDEELDAEKGFLGLFKNKK